MRLTILLFDGFTALDVVGGYAVLANVPGMQVEFAAAAQGIVAADSGRLGMLAYRRFDELASTDILYVPGGRESSPRSAKPAAARLHSPARRRQSVDGQHRQRRRTARRGRPGDWRRRIGQHRRGPVPGWPAGRRSDRAADPVRH